MIEKLVFDNGQELNVNEITKNNDLAMLSNECSKLAHAFLWMYEYGDSFKNACIEYDKLINEVIKEMNERDSQNEDS